MKKQVLQNWGKPCIWLNNQNPLDTPNLPLWQREYLEANCVFVNLDHRLYSPEPVVPAMFNPPPPPPPSQPLSVMEGPSRIPDNRNKGKQRQEVVIDENTVYLEDL
jgi:hypothetical protein